MVYSGSFRSVGWSFADADTDGNWDENNNAYPGHVVAFLSSSDIVYRKSSGVGAHQEGIWDIELKSPASKNITVNVKNKTGKDIEGGEVKFIAEGANMPLFEIGKVAFTTNEDYSVNKSCVVMKDNKYKMYVE